MRLKELIETVIKIPNIQGMHYLMLYSLFDLGREEVSSNKYAELYKAKFRIEKELWEKAHGLWTVDILLESDEPTKYTNQAASLLLGNVTSWDRQILRIFREFKDKNNVISYGRHLQKSKKIVDIMEVIRTLYDNNMRGQMEEYLNKLKEYKGSLNELMYDLCDFFIKRVKDAAPLFNCTWNDSEAKIIEEFLLNNENNELTLLFYIQRKWSTKALILYKKIINSGKPIDIHLISFMKLYLKIKGEESIEEQKTLTSIELTSGLTKELTTIYNIPNTHFNTITPKKKKTLNSPPQFELKTKIYRDELDEKEDVEYGDMNEVFGLSGMNFSVSKTRDPRSRNIGASDPSKTKEESEIQCKEFLLDDRDICEPIKPFDTNELLIEENAYKKYSGSGSIEVIQEEPEAESSRELNRVNSESKNFDSEDSIQGRVEDSLISKDPLAPKLDYNSPLYIFTINHRKAEEEEEILQLRFYEKEIQSAYNETKEISQESSDIIPDN